MPTAMAYLITWSTYGTWLHGDERGWHDRKDDFHPGKYKHDPLLEERRRRQLKYDAVTLTPQMRKFVEQVVREVSEHRGWRMLAVNARSNHTHVVVGAPCEPAKALGDFKAYATRRLRELGLMSPDKTIWTRKGDKRFLNDEEAVRAAVDYVLNRQDGG